MQSVSLGSKVIRKGDEELPSIGDKDEGTGPRVVFTAPINVLLQVFKPRI
jgi:hypothetical protein